MARKTKAQPKKAADTKQPPQKRGPRYKTVDLDLVFELASDGMTQEAIARCAGIDPSSWYSKIKTEPEILEAYKRGKAQNQRFLISKLKSMAGKENLGAICFLLKTRHNFEESSTHKHVGGGEGSAPIRTQTDIDVKISEMTPEQRKARIKELQEKHDRARGD